MNILDFTVGYLLFLHLTTYFIVNSELVVHVSINNKIVIINKKYHLCTVFS